MKILSKQEAIVKLLWDLPGEIDQLMHTFKDTSQQENLAHKETPYRLYLVGGCIRDTFLGKTPKDYDLCTNVMPERVIEILTKAGISAKLQGAKFGVVVARLNYQEFEIATFRTDVSTDNNRHPEVKLGVTIEEDVMRRDFTINGLFFDLYTEDIVDLVGGIDDLEMGKIRCIGKPEDRFEEDHLRKLRAVRFAARTGFTIDDDTFLAIHTDPSLNISKERIFAKVKDPKDTAPIELTENNPPPVEGELVKIWNSALDREQAMLMLWELRLFPSMFGVDETDFSRLRFDTYSIFVASVYDKGFPKIGLTKTLVQHYKFETRFAKGIEFLINIGYTTDEDFQPLKWYNAFRNTDLTPEEVLIYNNETSGIKAFINWKPEEGLAEMLMAKGFKGKELGEELDKEYYLSYLKILKETESEISQELKNT